MTVVVDHGLRAQLFVVGPGANVCPNAKGVDQSRVVVDVPEVEDDLGVNHIDNSQ